MAASISAGGGARPTPPTTTRAPKDQRRPRQVLAERDHHGGEEDKSERKSEQEAHMGSAHGAQLGGELALRGVAHGLRGSGNDGKDDPEPRRIEHRNLWDCPSGA